MNKKKKLNPREELFCKIYSSDEEFFGNGTNSYLKAYGLKKRDYMWAKSCAYKLLTKPHILDRINELLENGVLNDVFVDKELSFLVKQNADLSTKIRAISEYNKLKSRIIEKKELVGPVEVSWKK
jgi:hypothetical protein